MAKQLNLKMNFQADTSQVQRALTELQTSLNSISNITPMNGTKLTADLALAKQSAKDLQFHLNNAFNMKTGNLDLSKLDASLRSSGQSLGVLSTNLLKAGTQGEQAFLNIQQSVGNASVQIYKANGALASFMTTLKNTARWQISSSILHGFVQAISSAWGYAKDLDKSLNNIRIVTGYNADKMADFAKEANKAARALSTTTTKYTDASLIFYQQGLSDDEVQKRTDVTIKMANAAGQSAEVVSDQLTSVWNNFYDGTKSLEYYADVMTALGAATASSTDEIAGGLEKFAAIGETIGLSYEYAASALATITSNTRQSEEVVGTALKTIFARIQGLNLGDTLEDGTTLNKYSEALQKVGISIFDSSGELKKMDNILDEMAAKWSTLSKDQQAALAQTVAGIRQYTQLIALMDNWDKGDSDSMVANLETAYNSEGSLDKQANIYAESWQAAADRVKAATEDIYRDLFPTEKLTGMMEGIEVLLQGVDGLVQAFGGLQGILLFVSSILLSTFQTQIGSAIDNLISKVGGGLTSAFSTVSNAVHGVSDGTLKWYQAIGQIFGGYQNVVASTGMITANLHEVQASSQDVTRQSQITAQYMEKGVSATLAMSMEMAQAAQEAEFLGVGFQQYNANMMEINNVQALIEQSSRLLTKEQQTQLALLQEQAQAANQQMLTAQNTLEIEQQKKEILLSRGGDQLSNIDRFDMNESETHTRFTSDVLHAGNNQQSVQESFDMYGSVKGLGDAWSTSNVYLESIKGHLAVAYDSSVDLLQVNQDANGAYATMVEASQQVSNAQKQWPNDSESYREALQGIAEQLQTNEGFAGAMAKKFLEGKTSAEDIEQGIKQATNATKTFATATGSSSKHLGAIESQVKSTHTALTNLSTSAENFKNAMQKVGQTLQTSLESAMSVGQVMSTMASGFSSIAMGISSISNAFETFADEDASFTTKLTAGAMAATMGIRGLSAALGFLNTFIQSATTYTTLKNAADLASKAITDDKAKAELANLLVTKLKVKEEEKEAVVDKILIAAQKGQTGATLKDTIANYANVASQAAKFWYISLIIAAVAALTAVIYFLVTAEDAETKALKQSEEALKKSTEAHQQAQEATEAFQATLADYQDGLKGLQDLTGETEKLQAAVEENNKKAKELIETYGLFGKYHYGDFGEIIIDEDALKEVENTLSKAEKFAAMIRYSDEISYLDSQSAKTASDTASGITYKVAYEYTMEGSGSRAYEEQGAYVDPNTKARNYQAATQTSGEITGIKTQTNTLSTDDLQAISEAFDDVRESAEGISPNAEALIDHIKANSEQYDLSSAAMSNLEGIINNETIGTIEGFTDGVNKATEASLYYAKQLLGLYTDDNYAEAIGNVAQGDRGLENLLYEVKDAIISGKEDDVDDYINTQTKKLKDEVLDNVSAFDAGGVTERGISQFVSDTLDLGGQDKGEDWITQHYSEIFGAGNSYDGNITSQEMGKHALEARGFKVTAVTDKAGKTEYSYIDTEGESHTTSYDNEEAQKAWAEAIGQYAIEQQADKKADAIMSPQEFETIMTDVTENGYQYGADWSTALLTGFANNNDFDFSSLKADLTQEEWDALNNMSGEQLAEMFGLDTTELTKLGFDNAAAFATAFQEGLGEYDIDDAKTGVATEFEISEEVLETYMEDFKQTGKAINLTESELLQLVKAQLAFERSTKKAQKVLSDNADALDDSKKGTVEYLEACEDLATELNGMFGEGTFDTETVANNLDDIRKALDGDAAALNRLQAIAAEHLLEEEVGELPDRIQTLLTEIANLDSVEVGEKIVVGQDPIASELETLYQEAAGVILAQGGNIAEAMEYANSVINAVGFETPSMNMIAQTVEVTGELPAGWEPIEGGKIIGPDGKELTGVEWTAVDGETYTYKYMTLLPESGAKMEFTKKKESIAPDSSSKDKGSKKEPKKLDTKKADNLVDRYKEIDDSLDDIRDTMDDIGKATDRLYGASRINQMEKYNKQLLKEIDALKEKKEQAKALLELDKTELNSKAADLGLSLSYDSEGNISNYTTQLTSLQTSYKARIEEINARGGATEEEEKEIEELEEKIDEFKDALSQYEETRELIEDLDNEMDDKFYEWQDNNAEKLSYKLEIKMELNDDELRALDYKLSKTEDDFYRRAEAATLMGEQLTINTKSLGEYSVHLAEVEAKYAAGDISQEAYVAALNQINDGIYNNLNALQDLDRQMMEYYGQTLAQAGEEVDKFTSQLEKQTTILEHYKTLVDLMGKSTDYDKIGIILEGQANTTKNEMIAAREEYEMLAKEKDEMYLKWQTAATEEQAELYKKQYEAALEASDEAQEEYLSKAEAYGEALNAILENSLNKFGQDLENALTGGTSFDQMTTRMERAASLQEEYLTTTNKIYETNKLINKAQQEIDKSTNSVAKQRLKQFINETDQLQKKNRLSSYELEIQQAKYDLLLAEIALEEAQDAKSQVRLQRDAEGNFGYVYTADQDKISEAQQNLADTQNSLYNIALEGANGYAEKYYQTLNELYNTLDEINRQYHEGAFESEQEYQNAMLEAKEYYYALLEDYSDLYTIAISTDARALEDSWSREFNSMVYNTETWKNDVEEYVQNVTAAFAQWDEAMDTLAGEAGIGGDLSNLSNAVDDIDKQSQELLLTLTKDGGVLDTIQTEIDAVSSLTDAYGLQRTEIQALTKEYEQLAEAIWAKKRAEAMKEEPTNVAPSAKGEGSADGDGGSGSDTNSTSEGDGVPRVGDVVTYTGGQYYYDSDGTAPVGTRGIGKKVTITRIMDDGSKYPIHVKSSDSAYGWLTKSQISGYDTGGYTGAWGSYGKLAVLHEKELVLDKNDTENFLSGMELLNNIIQIIDLQAMNSSIGGALSSPGLGNIKSEALEQTVTIEASFPNVSSRTEIEEAFTTLVNRASQYANRK